MARITLLKSFLVLGISLGLATCVNAQILRLTDPKDHKDHKDHKDKKDQKDHKDPKDHKPPLKFPEPNLPVTPGLVTPTPGLITPTPTPMPGLITPTPTTILINPTTGLPLPWYLQKHPEDWINPQGPSVINLPPSTSEPITFRQRQLDQLSRNLLNNYFLGLTPSPNPLLNTVYNPIALANPNYLNPINPYYPTNPYPNPLYNPYNPYNLVQNPLLPNPYVPNPYPSPLYNPLAQNPLLPNPYLNPMYNPLVQNPLLLNPYLNQNLYNPMNPYANFNPYNTNANPYPAYNPYNPWAYNANQPNPNWLFMNQYTGVPLLPGTTSGDAYQVKLGGVNLWGMSNNSPMGNVNVNGVSLNGRIGPLNGSYSNLNTSFNNNPNAGNNNGVGFTPGFNNPTNSTGQQAPLHPLVDSGTSDGVPYP